MTVSVAVRQSRPRVTAAAPAQKQTLRFTTVARFLLMHAFVSGMIHHALLPQSTWHQWFLVLCATAALVAARQAPHPRYWAAPWVPHCHGSPAASKLVLRLASSNRHWQGLWQLACSSWLAFLVRFHSPAYCTLHGSGKVAPLSSCGEPAVPNTPRWNFKFKVPRAAAGTAWGQQAPHAVGQGMLPGQWLCVSGPLVALWLPGSNDWRWHARRSACLLLVG